MEKELPFYKALIPFRIISKKGHDEWSIWEWGESPVITNLKNKYAIINIAISGITFIAGILGFAKLTDNYLSSPERLREKLRLNDTVETIAISEFDKYDLDGDHFLNYEEFRKYFRANMDREYGMNDHRIIFSHTSKEEIVGSHKHMIEKYGTAN